jgi:hypothetical protein
VVTTVSVNGVIGGVVAGKEIVPALGLESFSCPHVNCGAIAHQSWFKLYIDGYEKGDGPHLPNEENLTQYKRYKDADPDVIKFLEKIIQRTVFFDSTENNKYLRTELINVFISKCYSCGGVSIWRADELVYPLNLVSIAPNEGMPPDVKADFLEANEILDKSPRGAAALLRLCIQKLMIHLEEKGENINNDIASLVRKGLDPRIQKALDVVRVVGNSAVHPGQIDLRDDETTASKLFGLVNVIVESQITQAQHIEQLYDAIVPKTVKAQIEKRDAPKQIEHKDQDDGPK